MDSNLAVLRKPEDVTLLHRAYEAAVKDAKPAWRDVADLIVKKSDWAVMQKVEFLRDVLPCILSSREIGRMRRQLAA
jgi:hypothetical protein